MKTKSALGLVIAAGIAGSAGANETPTKIEPSVGKLNHVAHIYFNVATGEKITTLLGARDAQQGVDGVESSEIWVQTTAAMCADNGYTTEFYYDMDDPEDPSTLHEYLFDWGDIAMDTVVDCVQVHWVTDHQDTDSDGDMLADGVVGFAGSWTYWDAMNGRSPAFDCIASPLISIGFYNLPGELSDPFDQELAFYTADIDLGTSFGTSLTFEIGDTDGDRQGAAVHHSQLDEEYNSLPGVPDIDPDLNGLADWGWSLIFNQPGTVDVDNADGDNNLMTGVDGDILALATAGVAFGAPTPGHSEFDSVAQTWSWVSDGPTAGLAEDVFNTAHLNDSSFILDGPWWFGGLDCSPDQIGYTPAAMFQTVLYGPPGYVCCCPDVNQDGALDFFDLSYFLQNTVDYNNDTVFDFFDISTFLSEFGQGCP